MWRMIVLDWVSPSYLLFRPIINWNNTQCGVLFQVRVSDDVFQTFVCRQYYQHTTPYPHTFRHEFLKALVKYWTSSFTIKLKREMNTVILVKFNFLGVKSSRYNWSFIEKSDVLNIDWTFTTIITLPLNCQL